MDSNVIKPATFDIKKEKRFQAKKRKLEALLNLFQEDEKSMNNVKMKKTGGSLQEDYKTLKDELKKYTKKPEVDPIFYLTEHGFKSKLNFKNDKISKNVKPLFIRDVYQLLLRSVIGHMSPYTFKWSKLEQPQNITKTVMLIVEGLPKSIILQNRSSLTNIIEIFSSIVEIASTNISFPQELINMHKVTHFHIENADSYSSMFPSKKVVKVNNEKDAPTYSKLHLILSPIQLVMENYPLPKSVFQYSKSDNYTFSKDSYLPVTSNSPLFALDCEMCRTEKSNNELTRVAIVNEKLEVVYETLVKPKSKIVDYMTKFSGITKGMLNGVKTRLEDVQRNIRTLLPADAILCGQSLNCDLHALKMIHPYCIDTSIIYNGSGMRAKKDSLKYLSMVHLNETIQNKKSGHNPVEDALATMKLVQLKLSNSITFGDACIGNDTDSDKKIDNDAKEAKLEENSDENKNNSDQDLGFFELTSKYDKKICLIGNKSTLDMYGEDIPDSVQKVIKSNDKKTVKATLNNMEDFDLTISHIDFNTSEESNLIEELNNMVKLIYDCCAKRTMFMVLTTDVDSSTFEDIKHGILMAAVKNT